MFKNLTLLIVFIMLKCPGVIILSQEIDPIIISNGYHSEEGSGFDIQLIIGQNLTSYIEYDQTEVFFGLLNPDEESAISVEEIKVDIFNLSVSPNPVSSRAFLNILASKFEMSDLRIEIFSSLGIAQENFKYYRIQSDMIELDVSGLSSGMYYIKLKIPNSANYNKISKFIVIR